MFWRSFLHIMLILWRNLVSNKSMYRYNGLDLYYYVCLGSLLFPFKTSNVHPELRLAAFGHVSHSDICHA
jgi:hypothetical protein